MDESNVVDLLPLIAERVLTQRGGKRVYADRIEREFGGDPDFEDAEGLVRGLRACAESIERVGTLEAAPALIRYLNRTRAARLSRDGRYALSELSGNFRKFLRNLGGGFDLARTLSNPMGACYVGRGA